SWGIAVDFVDAASLDALRQAVRPDRTRLIWIETPANPLWSVTDIAGAADIAHNAGALLAVDSTAATPVLTRPLALGADLVMYPGLPRHPGHAVAARQMTGGFGGMLSIRVRGGAGAAIAAAARVEVWKRATSLGGVESLIEHRASIEGDDSPAPPDLLRLSVGIEDPGDLIADLEPALGG